MIFISEFMGSRMYKKSASDFTLWAVDDQKNWNVILSIGKVVSWIYISLIDPLKSKNEFKNHKPHKLNFNDVEKKNTNIMAQKSKQSEYANIKIYS